ncbi:MAG: alcohol dehydrogenase catalytic domain-containing protein [Armatimonadota bacterium]|nr:alcohol dehydrogenase catalytic domain-containing protein [Armatimonadota bacterium]MDR5675793.1 alcohol dehydrogenase catalytic domain-containing protein [Armatimonadota bacterium]MDR5688629.1 alcohol dehydrogenase catalytic domain-containing protein [Armatimonadota bacterium]MDR7386101.1 alcohol dehydrogenase catalytic domain-containing protein [Armatimonadota bacterium]MDR7389910.1 alcohol dehydrogenase catalytic domain-containing protein [Armatimonadota bacterium]
MRNMAVVEFGKPLAPARLEIPRPGPGEVLVRVLACGVCRSDLKIAGGLMPFSANQRLPHVPGHEISGEVAEAGAGVELARGQRVVVHNYWGCGSCPYCVEGQENLCDALRGWVGFTTPGGFEEYLVVPADHLLPVPPQVDPLHAATVSCALGTAYHAVVIRGAVRAGETVTVVGSGGVGLYALQVARAAGARTVAVDLREEALQAARGVGADAAALPEKAPSVVSDLTRGRGADVVVDCVGSRAGFPTALELVRKGGRVVQVGYVTDPQQYPALATDRVVLREVQVVGSRYVTRPELARALHLVASGALRPVISRVVDLEQANEALEDVRADRAVGRVVIRVARDL